MRKYYPIIRTLHLYVGLVSSPFILIFSLSVLVFNHIGFFNRFTPVQELPPIKTRLASFPLDTNNLAMAKAICTQLGINGEIDFIARDADHISFPVVKPGLRTIINVNSHTDSVVITRQREGTLRALSFLHRMPGQHNAALRGNSIYMKVWKVMADGVVYLLLFLTTSGIFLWWFLKAERRLGFIAIGLGVFIFSTLLLLIFY
ncbi:PepSY-associated TM helix domain-containing protein [Spirosoma luteum]|uniref:PepSY-associated TM helix domain-containing protein n=1 Tax=Spirosoma luteum TaxID=431553 RepID=UPI00037285CA|nr:PepSY-associated TM helix domain-containing protein [Spirosoma luteum]